MLSPNKHKADTSDIDDLPLKVRVRQMKVKKMRSSEKSATKSKINYFLGFNQGQG